jgi:hypothetical protein
MMMSEVIENVSKKPIPPHQKAVIVEVSAVGLAVTGSRRLTA